jgi:hypothetical protein
LDVSVSWSRLGFTGPAHVRDLWTHEEIGVFDSRFDSELAGHASRLLRVTPVSPVREWRATVGTLGHGAIAQLCPVSPGGQCVRLGAAGSTIGFDRVNVANGGGYALTVRYANGDAVPRAAVLTVNGSPTTLVFPNAGDWGSQLTSQGITISVALIAGSNTIALSNAGSPPPDIIGITIQPALAASPPTYTLSNIRSGGVIDVAFGSTAPGATIVQWFDSGASSQRWQLIRNDDGTYRMVNDQSGLALQVRDTSTPVALDQAPYVGGTNQHWRPVAAGNGSFVLVNVRTGLVVRGSAQWSASRMGVRPATGARNQHWMIAPVM